MPDESERQGLSWETSPMDIAKQISKSLAERIVIAKVSAPWIPSTPLTSAQVNDELWDLERPLEASCRLQLLDFDDPEGMAVDNNMSGN
jgi:threonyl-tRNA synthetase